MAAKIQELYPRARGRRSSSRSSPRPARGCPAACGVRLSARRGGRRVSFVVAVTPVRFADIDHAGIVYYPRFFHYFMSRSRSCGARGSARGAYRELLDRDRVGFPAVRAECDFKAPAEVRGHRRDRGHDRPDSATKSITFGYAVHRAADDGRAGGARCAVREGASCAPSSTSRDSSRSPVPDRVT